MSAKGGSNKQKSSSTYQQCRNSIRQTRNKKRQRLKNEGRIGVVDRKHSLKLGLLNVDGLSASTFEDVQSVIDRKSLDVCILLETKRRHEEIGTDITIPGYDVKEIRRSDTADDKGGGGIAYYTKQSDGVLFREHSPPIADPALHYIRTERFWITVDSLQTKTAICGVYLGCQYHDDRHGPWNDGLLQVLHAESMDLRAKGYRVVFLGDFNAHIGSEDGVGIPGNNNDINYNGERFLHFLKRGNFCHVNGMKNLASGLWTRQRGNSKSVLDYAVVSSEHQASVHGLLIDDRGILGGGSDHNFVILTLNDMFVKKRRLQKLKPTKKGWNDLTNVDWDPFKIALSERLSPDVPEGLSVDALASKITSALLAAGEKCIGRKSISPSKQTVKLPQNLVNELNMKRSLEKQWKSKVADSLSSPEEISACETAFLNQKTRVNDLLFQHKNRNRAKIKEMCSGSSPKARKFFWNAISTKVKSSSDISAVVDPVSGELKCNVDEIITEVEDHLCRVFNGTLDNLGGNQFPGNNDENHAPDPVQVPNLDGGIADHLHGHGYAVPAFPGLPKVDNSAEIMSDPAGWADEDFSLAEVTAVVKTLNGGRSSGWDSIPNEFLMNSPDSLLSWLVVLFNQIKATGSMPSGWNKGRVTLIHKSGSREELTNYRPITVIISLSGLFSKLLNQRLTLLVESHNLLGEIQNGFRKDRQMADNNFILDSILMKSKFLKQNVHLCYVDISKAYDSVNREILWRKLSSLGFSGAFLGCLKALYSGDSLISVVNGVSTRPVYPRRGLRQGCSLSPLLFALYISDVGSALTASSEGFQLGGVNFSGLLFADDIVLVSNSFQGLESLVSLVQSKCSQLRLLINPKKSKIVTPDDVDQLVLLDEENKVTLSLSKVLSYKYLGTDTTLLMSSTGSMKQQRCIQTAKRYKFACFHIARTGPDVIDTALATWSNIAIPSILSGCAVIPFSDATIETIERLQSQLAKHILGLPPSAPNICAQTELGLKPFRMVLYQLQLNFYLRVLHLPRTRWVRCALADHLLGNWASPYIAYIAKIRQKLQLWSMPHTQSLLKLELNAWFVAQCNLDISRLSLPCIPQISSFSRSRYVSENRGCPTIAKFLLGSAGLGNRAPRPGRNRAMTCSLCRGPLNEAHVAFLCPNMENYRYHHTNIAVFKMMCLTKQINPLLAFKWYVTGLDWNGNPIPTTDYLKRGHILENLVNEWLNRT